MRPDPAAAAAEVLAAHHPDALGAFVAGSVMRGEGTATSDIDVVVLYAALDHAWRHSLVHRGWPVEVFVHDPETLAWFFDEDVRFGIPALASMVAEGLVLGTDATLHEAQRTARALIEAGPREWPPGSIERARYALTDLLDDLRAPRGAAEARAIAARMHDPLAELWLRGQGRWCAKGKSVPRLLARTDAAFAVRFDEAFAQAFAGRGDALVALCEAVLEPHGGPLFAGYHLDAPPEWRKAR